jgi:hypothetical protein
LNKQKLIAGAIATGLLVIFLLWPEDEAPKSPEQLSAPAEPAAKQRRRAAPDSDSPPRWYGTAEVPQAPGEMFPGTPRPYAYDDYQQGWDQRYGAFPQRAERTERFDFRPLTERERERLDAQRRDPYYVYPPPQEPISQPYADRSARPPPPAYRQTPPYPDWRTDGYGYGPYGSPPPLPEAWERPDWDERGYGEDLWGRPPVPEWGSQPWDRVPPAQRMYPNLGAEPNRSFTAR